MVHPLAALLGGRLMGAAFLGGSLAGMASRHVGSLNLISLTTGTLTGIWIVQNHPNSVPNLKEELRRFAAAIGEEEGEGEADAHWTRGAVPLDDTILGTPVKEAVSELRAHRKAFERVDQQVRTLVTQSEETRAKLTVALAQLEEEKKVVQTACHQAHEQLTLRMDELKLERRARTADKERLDYYLDALREIRDLEVSCPPPRRSIIARVLALR